jgi:hypothetical protein
MAEDYGQDELERRVRHWLGQAESALDLATAAMTRVGELDPGWRHEFQSDVGVLRSKLDTLRETISNHG